MTPQERYKLRHPDRLRAAAARWRERNPDYHRIWTANNPEVRRKAVKAWIKRNPEASRAHHKVKYAKKVGKLLQQPCRSCGNPESQAHHEDYRKPLDVTWLCRRCHRELHRGDWI
jgi:ribosomal protein S27AE